MESRSLQFGLKKATEKSFVTCRKRDGQTKYPVDCILMQNLFQNGSSHDRIILKKNMVVNCIFIQSYKLLSNLYIMSIM